MLPCYRDSMFTERTPCQNDSAVAKTLEENNHRVHTQMSTHRCINLKEECSMAEDELVNSEKGNPGPCNQICSQRKSTRISQGGRVLRNHRYRRMFDESRHTKRLFTPEIKKYLKDWLIRRRDHPYPNRDEKKTLAIQTGLTYIQICNWFANWRRKLKNAGSEDQRTWSHLIKSYNTQAEGNVEHFSICSDDSIWDGKELADSGDPEDDYSDGAEAVHTGITVPTAMDHCYSIIYHGIKSMVCSNGEMFNSNAFLVPNTTIEAAAQCYTVSSTTTEDEGSRVVCMNDSSGTNNEKIKEMETRAQRKVAMKRKMENKEKLDNFSPQEHETSKTLSLMKRKHSGTKASTVVGATGTKKEFDGKEPPISKFGGGGSTSFKAPPAKKSRAVDAGNSNHTLFTKWMASAVNFQPSTSYVPWKPKSKMTLLPRKAPVKKLPDEFPTATNAAVAKAHGQDELDAAEALTRLAGIR